MAAALDRFSAEGPVAVSLEDIRRQAGVSVGALYHHFADKAALFDAVYVELTGRFQAGFIAELRTATQARDGVQGGVRFYLRWVARHRQEATIQLGPRPDGPELAALNRAFLSEVMGWWDTHVHYGTLRALPLDLIHALWLGPAAEYARQWVAGDTRRPPTAVAGLLAEAAWNALKEPS
ncbi:MAG TPA: helix-turn-helix domain-containing protein [Solirubrobacteraceae bacterium]|nr:helix-turn-helix domain-containing protein [Solirubrobacteraceae bacterium]